MDVCVTQVSLYLWFRSWAWCDAALLLKVGNARCLPSAQRNSSLRLEDIGVVASGLGERFLWMEAGVGARGRWKEGGREGGGPYMMLVNLCKSHCVVHTGSSYNGRFSVETVMIKRNVQLSAENWHYRPWMLWLRLTSASAGIPVSCKAEQFSFLVFNNTFILFLFCCCFF